MTPKYARRKAGDLRRRCPVCKRLRKYREPDTNVGGELHPRRPLWGFVYLDVGRGRVTDYAGIDFAVRDQVRRVKVCGWCVARARGDELVDTPQMRPQVKRDAKTGRVIR